MKSSAARSLRPAPRRAPFRGPVAYIEAGDEPWIPATLDVFTKDESRYFLMFTGAELQALLRGIVSRRVRHDARIALRHRLVRRRSTT